MRRAAEVFVLEEWALHSPFAEKIWRAYSQPEAGFISVAATHWEIVVSRRRDWSVVTIRGPETRATTVPIPQDAEFFGVQFRRGAFMPGLLPARLVDATLRLPEASCNAVWLHGAAWEVPSFDNLDAFVERLVRAGLLIRDPLVEAALRGEAVARSPRSVQRRVLRATGLTQATIRQIERAEQAVMLLERGRSIVMALPPSVRSSPTTIARHALTKQLRVFIELSPGERSSPGADTR